MKAYHKFTSLAQSENANSRVPLMTIEAFAEAIGMTLATLRGQVYRGYWPTLKIGKKVFINLEAVRLIAIQKYNELPR